MLRKLPFSKMRLLKPQTSIFSDLLISPVFNLLRIFVAFQFVSFPVRSRIQFFLVQSRRDWFSRNPNKPSTNRNKPSTDPDKPSTNRNKPSTNHDTPSTKFLTPHTHTACCKGACVFSCVCGRSTLYHSGPLGGANEQPPGQ